MLILVLIREVIKRHGICRRSFTVNEWKSQFSAFNAAIDVRRFDTFKRNV